MAPKLSLYASLLDPDAKEDVEPTKDEAASSKKQTLNAGSQYDFLVRKYV